jgi:hypothetical protein
MQIKPISNYFSMTFVIQETLKMQDFIYFEETSLCYATFYFIEKS